MHTDYCDSRLYEEGTTEDEEWDEADVAFIVESRITTRRHWISKDYLEGVPPISRLRPGWSTPGAFSLRWRF
jgi:hypothetical protein